MKPEDQAAEDCGAGGTTSQRCAAPETRRSAGQDGFALLVVLWIFAVLFVIGAEFAQGMRQDAAATVNFADETQSYYLATAAANLTFYKALLARDDLSLVPLQSQASVEAIQPGEQPLPPLIIADGEWHQEPLWGAEQVWIKVTDEGGKIPLNQATEQVLRHVLTNMGLDIDAASGVTDAIMDWMDRDQEHRINGAEDEYYGDLPQPYRAKNAPFDSLQELLLVKGISRDLFYGGTEDHPVGLRDIFTVFSHVGGTSSLSVNIRTAPPAVLQVLLGITDEEEMVQLLEARVTDTANVLTLAQARIPDPTVAEILTDEPPKVLFVEVQAQLPGAKVKAHVGGVIDVDESTDGIYVLRWFDAMPAQEISTS